jgi:hypothetical protein
MRSDIERNQMERQHVTQAEADDIVAARQAKDFQAIRFREGDLITIGEVTLECATHKGRRVLLAPKKAGAKVRKRLTPPEQKGYDSAEQV